MADAEQKPQWARGPYSSDTNALCHLRSNGFSIDKGRIIVAPPGRIKSAEDISAIAHLVEEWEYKEQAE